MEPVSKALQLLRRQEELETASRSPGGTRVTEERELHQIRAQLARCPHAVRSVLEAARSLNRSIGELSVRDVERWLGTEHT